MTAEAWVRSEEYQTATGRYLRPGVEFSVTGERGRYRFLEHVRTAEGVEWITAAGGTKEVVMMRSFSPDRIKGGAHYPADHERQRGP